MLTRWQWWFAAAGVTVVTLGLVILDLTDLGYRRWWASRALTTDTVAALAGRATGVLQPTRSGPT